MPNIAARIWTSIAAKYKHTWGNDPRTMPQGFLNLMLDTNAFFKATRYYSREYQHVLPVPDGRHPDGVAHLRDGRGFIVVFNPGEKAASVSWKELFWKPEIELDPKQPAELSDWTDPLRPRKLTKVNLLKPVGEFSIGPRGYRVIGVNFDFDAMKAEVRHQRSLIGWPAKGN